MPCLGAIFFVGDSFNTLNDFYKCYRTLLDLVSPRQHEKTLAVAEHPSCIVSWVGKQVSPQC